MTTRDLTRTYPRKQFVAKLRRLADAVEARRPFVIRIAGERVVIPAGATFNIEHERTRTGDEVEFQLLWKRRR